MTDDLELALVQTIESAGEQCLDRTGWLSECGALVCDREKLLGEERVATGVLDDALPDIRIDRRGRELFDECSQQLRGERLELNEESGGRRASPTRTFVEQITAREAQQEDGTLRPLAKVFD